ncbi:transporter substrate-binding domain-containing protein [Paucibacter sp. PLA-PC-4]|uniref:substrate-binding periplasmic protein n=1 Tax=Paucibacter sp. PLA-PC-4 TaxID=2993655 RepID=UPI002249389B|nr:transporter substrate-binding domain-containing protein [Paucibacter sp. PLA-PC-4]MCX2860319.1 transporter substrate-binding domain-containing protein [Paucibacter sp. PLA-PC-4]
MTSPSPFRRDGNQRRRSLLGLGLAGLLGSARAQSEERLTVLLEEFAPYSFTDARGQAAGYAVELARELLARARIAGDFEFSSWPRVSRRAQLQANVLLPAIVRLPEREAQFHWVAQIGLRQGWLFRLRSRSDVQPRDLDAAKAYLTAVIKDDVSEHELVTLGFSVGQHLDRSADYDIMLRKFFAGRSQLLALNRVLAPELLRRHGHDPQLIEPLLKFSESRPSMALSLPSSASLAQRLRLAWDGMRRDGTVAALAARYGMPLPD